ncbi:MAG: hypothetical protein IKC01_08545 [Clostridia bacterium]|nr:hypothetical protein [Clostridia bacterium]
MRVYSQEIIETPLYRARLENNVIINVFGNYAEGSDGKTYYHIGKEDENGVLQTIGWSCDVDHAIEL